MTVKELIEVLNFENPMAQVELEGCDCVNPASGVKSEDGEVVVILSGSGAAR